MTVMIGIDPHKATHTATALDEHTVEHVTVGDESLSCGSTPSRRMW